jgi:hypothetical protein
MNDPENPPALIMACPFCCCPKENGSLVRVHVIYPHPHSQSEKTTIWCENCGETATIVRHHPDDFR